jgi:hypothetical protein
MFVEWQRPQPPIGIAATTLLTMINISSASLAPKSDEMRREVASPTRITEVGAATLIRNSSDVGGDIFAKDLDTPRLL